MIIKNLTLHNFRNYTDETFAFEDGVNVLCGRNAQGKTNCAEAVFYLCTGTSLRIKHDRQLIKLGESSAQLTAEAETKYGVVTLEATITENGRELKVNGCRVSRSVEFVGNLKSVFFSPGELRIVQDGPDERRRFLNLCICQNAGSYSLALMRYQRILDQRNALLKEKDLSLIKNTLPVWDEQLAKSGAVIITGRREFLRDLLPLAKEAHSYLTDGAEELSLSYESDYPEEQEEVEKKLVRSFSDSFERDIRVGFTTVGPHRDDFKISISGMDARTYASQGQTRTAALSLKLAQLELFKKIAGEAPVLILDDVMSELDLSRRRKLLERTRNVQCILTCTHMDRLLFGRNMKKIKIKEGRIV